MLKFLVAAGFVLTATVHAHALDPADFQGLESAVTTTSAWRNQSGSTMTIDIDTNGNVIGTYINRAAGTGCQNTPYVLNGRVNGSYIAFSVAWNNATANCNSATGWAGYAQVSGSDIQIVTNWNLAYQSASGSSKIEQGSDTFTYVTQESSATFLNE